MMSKSTESFSSQPLIPAAGPPPCPLFARGIGRIRRHFHSFSSQNFTTFRTQISLSGGHFSASLYERCINCLRPTSSSLRESAVFARRASNMRSGKLGYVRKQRKIPAQRQCPQTEMDSTIFFLQDVLSQEHCSHELVVTIMLPLFSP